MLMRQNLETLILKAAEINLGSKTRNSVRSLWDFSASSLLVLHSNHMLTYHIRSSGCEQRKRENGPAGTR